MSNEPSEEGRKFSLDEARALLPRVRSLTDRAAEEMSELAREIQALPEGDTRRAVLEQEYVERLNDWANELQDMG
ncbi:MAG: DUF2203 family protein, partial [Myxococcota bacterium]